MNKNSIRVRFAPSPTGYLHIGGLRTALFNYLFARHNNGKFILRIEDTDQSRQVEGAVDNLIKTLNYMGLSYDEGPEIGGNYGPYFQSQRLTIYTKHITELLKNGHAYYAFETSEELDEMRRIQQMQGLQTMYDRRARNLTENEVKDKLLKHTPYVIRLKVPLNSEIKFYDLIRGNVKIETNLIDDQVLVKSDGYPTYHFANVIDDHLMKISHVIRGEEWLTSVPKHILLYNAFGWEIPQLAHVPLILNPDKTKLSKRQGDVATEDFLRKGYLKEALLNFIALLGWNPGEGENREIFSIDELIKLFSIDKINSSGAVFNNEKLDWMNSEYMRMKGKNEPESLDKMMKEYYQKYNFPTFNNPTIGITVTTTTVTTNLEESGKLAAFMYPEIIDLTKENLAIINQESSQKVLVKLVEKISQLENNLSYNNLIEKCKVMFREIQNETNIKGKSFFQPIRLVISGQVHGSDLAQYLSARLENLGKAAVIKMISKNINIQER